MDFTRAIDIFCLGSEFPTGVPRAMDWDNVRVFLAVARAGQFVAAARRLGLDHATASRRVAAL